MNDILRIAHLKSALQRAFLRWAILIFTQRVQVIQVMREMQVMKVMQVMRVMQVMQVIQAAKLVSESTSH